MNRCFLLLEDGTLYQGRGFGAPAPLATEPIRYAEVVFNTSMTGYQEILTDPSYCGQMVVMTYPHIGNYGCEQAFDEGLGIPSPSFCSALIVRSFYEGPLPPGRTSVQAFLERHNVVGITDVDTRGLAIHLRTHGSQNAAVFRIEDENLTDREFQQLLMNLRAQPHLWELDLIDRVATNRITEDPGIGRSPTDPTLRFAVVDFGIKRSIIAELYKRNVAVTLFPPTVEANTILASGCDAVLLSNGPGDPALLQSQVGQIRQLLGKLPVFGICLGHQLITWALGGTTQKMKYGHHGGNHPVLDQESASCFVTSQNHGFATQEDSLPPDVKVWLRNANDQSVEGLKHTDLRVYSVQFHPESSPGPEDASWIFDTFITCAQEGKHGCTH